MKKILCLATIVLAVACGKPTPTPPPEPTPAPEPTLIPMPTPVPCKATTSPGLYHGDCAESPTCHAAGDQTFTGTDCRTRSN